METVPQQPISKAPISKTLPIVIALTGAVLLIGVSTAYNAMSSGHKKEAAKSTLQTKPATADPQQVSGFEKQQQMIAKSDADQAQLKQALDALQVQERAVPTPEADSSAPMTPAQSRAIYGNSPNAPNQTSGHAEARAQAKQQAAEREKRRVDALNSDTVAIDFQTHEQKPGATTPTVSGPTVIATQNVTDVAEGETPEPKAPGAKAKDPMAAYDFDEYGGKLYRVFEGTVLEGVVTNHADGGMAGPVLIMLTTDYYSHDHQQLLLPQGTRLIGQVQAVSSQQQHKLAVVFHRAVCPDGFSIDIDKYAGLDQIGTTGLATKVDHGYLQAFAAAAAIGGLGGLAQIGNTGSVLTPDSQIRNGISSQTSQESEQILNHFLNRLPIITLKEGTRARVAGTALKIYNQSITTYNTIFNNLKYFNSKQIWRTAENALMNSSVQNTYGETSGLQSQLNGQSQNASTVWKIMNLAISGTSSSFWGNQIVGASDRLSTLAHIEAMDAASTQCLGAVGAYNAARTNATAANTALDNSIYDTSVLTNSEVEQLNLLTMSNSHQLQEAQAQGQLQACLAAQSAVANMDKRNQASQTINDANFRITQQANNPTYIGGGSQTWTTYY